MDMDRIARRVNARLAARPSRRGFVATVSKLAIGASAVAAGLRAEEAAAQTIGDSCCTGASPCPDNTCPAEPGVKMRWSWYCTTRDGARYLCRDCNKGKRNICVIASPA